MSASTDMYVRMIFHDPYCFLWANSEYGTKRGSQLFTNGRISDPKTTSSICAVRLEVNEQLIPNGRDVSRQSGPTGRLDQCSIGVSTVMNLNFVATTTVALSEIDFFKDQAHALKTEREVYVSVSV